MQSKYAKPQFENTQDIVYHELYSLDYIGINNLYLLKVKTQQNCKN